MNCELSGVSSQDVVLGKNEGFRAFMATSWDQVPGRRENKLGSAEEKIAFYEKMLLKN